MNFISHNGRKLQLYLFRLFTAMGQIGRQRRTTFSSLYYTPNGGGRGMKTISAAILLQTLPGLIQAVNQTQRQASNQACGIIPWPF